MATSPPVIEPEEIPEEPVIDVVDSDPLTEMGYEGPEGQTESNQPEDQRPAKEKVKADVEAIKKPFQKETNKPDGGVTPGKPPVVKPPVISGEGGDKPPVVKPPVVNGVDGGKPSSNVAEQLKAGSNKYTRAIGKAAEVKDAVEAGQDLKENAPEYAKEIAKDQVKEAAKKQGKKWFEKFLTRQGGEAAAEGAAGGEAAAAAGGAAAAEGAAAGAGAAAAAEGAAVGAGAVAGETAVGVAAWPVVLIIIGVVVLLIIVALIVFLVIGYSLSKNGPAQTPTTAGQKNQATLVAAFGGDLSSTKNITQKVISSTRAKFQRIQAEANSSHGSRSLGDITNSINQVQNLINQVEAANNANSPTQVKTLISQLVTAENAVYTGLPWGQWIATDALKYANQPSSKFTTVTGAEDNLACASVVSTILNEVGVPQDIVSSTLAIWQNPHYQTIVSPLPDHQLSASLLKSNLGNLQPGDIVWWGNGVSKGRLVYYGALFNHVGIYVGDGQVIDNSSTRATVLKRALSRSPAFNGAKRYAP